MFEGRKMPLKYKKLGDVKYYLYRSDAKLRMLYPQIASHDGRKKTFEWKLTVGFGSVSRKVESQQDLDEDDMLEAVIKALEKAGEVGTVSEPKSYIKGTMPMRWGIYGERGMQEQEDGSLVYFGGLDKKQGILLALGGSSKHIMGHAGATSTSSLSYTQFLVTALLHGIEYGSAGLPYFEDQQTSETVVCEAIAIAQHNIRPPTQTLEFFAKTLMNGEIHNAERHIGIPKAKVILGTPLYVALVSQYPSSNHWGIIPD